MADIEIEIDGQKLKADTSQTVMQVADAAGIYIPRFCYHKHLSIAANCRSPTRADTMWPFRCHSKVSVRRSTRSPKSEGAVAHAVGFQPVLHSIPDVLPPGGEPARRAEYGWTLVFAHPRPAVSAGGCL